MPEPPKLPPGYDPKKDKIELVDYDPRWPELYLKEEAALRKALGKISGLRIDHYGSTAVPGMSAKPILDILLRVRSRKDWPKLIGPIEGMGYFYWADNPDKDTLYFAKGMPPFGQGRTHHIHVFELERTAELEFRDFLRANPDEARKYESLKRKLAARFAFNREAYTEAKTDFVETILRKAFKG